MNTGIIASARKFGSSARRHQTPSAMIISMSTAPSMSASLAMSPLLGGGVEHVDQPFADVGIERAEMRAISGLRRASDITSVHSLTCSIERTVKW